MNTPESGALEVLPPIDEMVRHSHARGRRFDELQMLIRGRMSDAEVKAEMIRCSSDRRRFATLQELLPDGDGSRTVVAGGPIWVDTDGQVERISAGPVRVRSGNGITFSGVDDGTLVSGGVFICEGRGVRGRHYRWHNVRRWQAPVIFSCNWLPVRDTFLTP